KDSTNIPRLAHDLCEKKGGGFIEYMWKKPNNSEESVALPKTSYVELFEPWQWILGTGVYLEDIEEDVKNRLDAILEELTQTLGKMPLGQTGYFYIFNSNKELILHPIIDTYSPDSVKTLISNAPLDEIIIAAGSNSRSYEYKWLSPLQDKDTYIHRKKVFVEYFEPLDWYVCASFYHSELEEPGVLLGNKILLVSTIFILLSLILTFYLSNGITKPMNELMNYVAKIPGDFLDINLNKSPTFRSYEANALGKVINEMLASIKKQQNNLFEEKAKALESEARMRDSEKKYRYLYEYSNDAIFLIKENKIIDCNQKTLELFNSDKSAIIGNTPSALSPKYQYDGQKSSQKENKILSEVLDGNSMFFEWKHQRPNGDLFDSSVSLNLVELDNERYVQATVRDITERKNNELELEEYRHNLEKLVETRTNELNKVNKELSLINSQLSDKNELISEQNKALTGILVNLKETQTQLIQSEKMASLGILTAGVAHEINNPVNYIYNGTIAVKHAIDTEYPQDKEKHEQLFEAIFTGVKRIIDIVKSLGKYSRTQKDDITTCNIHEVMDNCLTMLYNQYKSRIEIKKKWMEDIPLINANEGELHQVFLNILTNSIHAIADNGKIKIETNTTNDSLQVIISDSGEGISSENLKHIFDPFFTTKEPGNGTGLGLSITKKLVENQKGNISCKSKLGKGTTFIISLPITNLND
ncbi:MAG: cache domain-containing protein, partial [Bacteroidales bacterium]|nr:cache domain-containing protein [Bacteroidales bacterium]